MQTLLTDTFIGTLAGSIITLLGIWLNNAFQNRSKRNNREQELKSKIFLEAVEELSKAKQLLMKLPSITTQEMDDVTNNGHAVTKLSVIAKNDTVQAVTEFSTAIAYNILSLLPDKLPLDNLKRSISLLTNQIDSNYQKQNQTLNEMTAFNTRGDTDARLWHSLQGNFEFQAQQTSQLKAELDSKHDVLNKTTMELFLKCLKAYIQLSDLEVTAIATIRNELNLTFNETEYRNTIEKANKKMQDEFNLFIERANKS